jgi:hypothetical protein
MRDRSSASVSIAAAMRRHYQMFGLTPKSSLLLRSCVLVLSSVNNASTTRVRRVSSGLVVGTDTKRPDVADCLQVFCIGGARFL